MERTSFLPPSRLKPSSTTFDLSVHPRLGSTASYKVSPWFRHYSECLIFSLGAPAGFENALFKGTWSRSDGGGRVAVGGADRTVTVWNVESGQIQYKLPGHKGTVTCVDFHPKEPISTSFLLS
jgi:WD40 repeat protein